MSVAGMYPLNRAILRSPSLRSKSYLCRPKFSRLDVGRWAKKKLSSVRAQGEPVTCQHFSISRHSGFISDSHAEHVRYCTHPPKARHILRSPTHTWVIVGWSPNFRDPLDNSWVRSRLSSNELRKSLSLTSNTKPTIANRWMNRLGMLAVHCQVVGANTLGQKAMSSHSHSGGWKANHCAMGQRRLVRGIEW